MHSVHKIKLDLKPPKCGVVKMRETLRFSGRTLSATVRKQATGKV